MSRPGSVPLFALGIVAILVAALIVMDGRGRSVLGDVGNTAASDSSSSEAVPATEEQRAPSKDILERVRKHIALPEEPPPTVMSILDVELLRKKNAAFYAQAENGDYLVLTQTRAILYDPEGDRILDVVPVQMTTE